MSENATVKKPTAIEQINVSQKDVLITLNCKSLFSRYSARYFTTPIETVADAINVSKDVVFANCPVKAIPEGPILDEITFTATRPDRIEIAWEMDV